jgi:hypothetical protein
VAGEGAPVIHPGVHDIMGVYEATPWFLIRKLSTGKVHGAYVVQHTVPSRYCCNDPKHRMRPWSYSLICSTMVDPGEYERIEDTDPAVDCKRCRTVLHEIVSELDVAMRRLGRIQADVVAMMLGTPAVLP